MPSLTRIRHRIVDTKDWEKVRRARLEIEGGRLSRGPAGFDPSHKYIEDLKQKDFYAGEEFTLKQVTSPDFLDRFMDSCASVSPLMEFLTKALGLKW